MVTLAFFSVSVFLLALLAFFDMKLFEFSYLEALRNMLFSEIAAGRYIVVIGAFLGLVTSIIIDIRLYLARRKSNKPEENQF